MSLAIGENRGKRLLYSCEEGKVKEELGLSLLSLLAYLSLLSSLPERKKKKVKEWEREFFLIIKYFILSLQLQWQGTFLGFFFHSDKVFFFLRGTEVSSGCHKLKSHTLEQVIIHLFSTWEYAKFLLIPVFDYLLSPILNLQPLF